MGILISFARVAYRQYELPWNYLQSCHSLRSVFAYSGVLGCGVLALGGISFVYLLGVPGCVGLAGGVWLFLWVGLLFSFGCYGWCCWCAFF